MRNRYYQGPRSDHFDGLRFFHPGLPSSDKTLLEVLKWKIAGKRNRWPKLLPAQTGLRPSERVAGLEITHIGHASYLVQTEDQNILIDPVWAERASPFTWAGPRRANPPAIAFDHLPSIDAVLLTHNHYDHMDLRSIQKLWAAHHPRIFAPLGNDTILRAADASVSVTTGDWWQSFPLTASLQLTIVPAYHWSSRGLGDYRMALWGGFVLQSPGAVIYCAGDTAYRDGGAIFREIGKRFGPPTVAILPIGAYAPRWFMQTQHANPEEAMQIARDCGAEQLLGVHWGTFALTDEPVQEPAERLHALAETLADPARFKAFHPGDSWTAPQVATPENTAPPRS